MKRWWWNSSVSLKSGLSSCCNRPSLFTLFKPACMPTFTSIQLFTFQLHCSHYSNCSLFTIHYSLFTIHCSNCSLFTLFKLFTVHYSLFKLFTVHIIQTGLHANFYLISTFHSTQQYKALPEKNTFHWPQFMNWDREWFLGYSIHSKLSLKEIFAPLDEHIRWFNLNEIITFFID